MGRAHPFFLGTGKYGATDHTITSVGTGGADGGASDSLEDCSGKGKIQGKAPAFGGWKLAKTMVFSLEYYDFSGMEKGLLNLATISPLLIF